jgi:hypothetical protein
MSFRRLSTGHVVALLAALGLLLAMAPDWYSDKVADQLRDTQGKIVPQIDRETTPSQSQLHAYAAEAREKNAWQAGAEVRSVGPPSLSGLASLTGLIACALIAYRIIQPPGFNDAAVVKWGAPLGLLCVGVVAIASRFAARAEREARDAPAEPEATPSPAGASARAFPARRAARSGPVRERRRPRTVSPTNRTRHRMISEPDERVDGRARGAF